MGQIGQQQLTALFIGVLVIGLVVRRTLVTQTMRVWALSIAPILYAVIAGAAISVRPITVPAVIAIAIGLIAGGFLGYLRGVHTQVKAGPRPGTVVVKGSIVLVAILLGAFAIRYGLALYFARDPITVAAIGDGAISFAAGSLIVGRAMVYFAYQRLKASLATTVSRTL